ncbi:MAG: DUF4105 domain-containing protein [Xanthomonadales bacterium]|nr:DUF4105 domain-containing protein [Xanthomonadales bacterium]
MISTRIRPQIGTVRTGVLRTGWIYFCLVLFVWSQTVVASEIAHVQGVPDDAAEAWLVTYSPGEIYFERFGHNAIWLREPALGLDHTFNFGFFDFEQEDFFLRFMRGRMLYFSVAQPATAEFELYRQQNRGIRGQKLNLTTPQYQQLRDYLLNEIQPENRNYRYDYYLNNCSTRIRDAIDIGLDGELYARTGQTPANLNFRDQTRRLTEMQFWYYLGLETGLGFPVDRAVTRWDEMFIPMVLADEIAAMSAATAGSGKPLLVLDTMLFTSSRPAPAATPTVIWHRYLLLGLLLTAVAWLSGKFMPPVWLDGLSRAWVLINTTVGLILAALWLLTDHEASSNNANLLLFNPLLLLALIPKLQRIGALILIGGNVLAFVLLMLPKYQYNLDVLALVSPVNLAVALYLLRVKPKMI